METRKLGFYKHQDLSSQKIMSETEIGGLNTILGGKIQQTEITGKHMSPAFSWARHSQRGCICSFLERLGSDAHPGLRHLLVLSAMWVIWPAVIWGLK